MSPGKKPRSRGEAKARNIRILRDSLLIDITHAANTGRAELLNRGGTRIDSEGLRESLSSTGLQCLVNRTCRLAGCALRRKTAAIENQCCDRGTDRVANLYGAVIDGGTLIAARVAPGVFSASEQRPEET